MIFNLRKNNIYFSLGIQCNFSGNGAKILNLWKVNTREIEKMKRSGGK